MKNITLIFTALAVLSLASCKKAYDCTCKTSEVSRTYESIMTQYDDFADESNEAYAEIETEDYTESVVSVDKTSKAEINAVCATSEDTNYSEEYDFLDADTDGEYFEPAYSITTVTKTECSAAKK